MFRGYELVNTLLLTIDMINLCNKHPQTLSLIVESAVQESRVNMCVTTVEIVMTQARGITQIQQNSTSCMKTLSKRPGSV